jgi:hypothetical protein
MIAFAKFSEAQRLLTEGTLSRRKIAALVGISRSTVSAIASGSYAERIARQQAHTERSIVPRGPLARCRQCGGLVYMPCWACHVRQLKEKEQEIQRAARRRARQRAAAQLLRAVRRAQWQRDGVQVQASETRMLKGA